MKKIVVLYVVLLIVALHGVPAIAACVAGDSTPPAKIIDLVPTVVSDKGIIFMMTLPSDLSGISKIEYRSRAGTAITALNWASPTTLAVTVLPPAGQESFPVGLTTGTVGGYNPSTKYYAAVKIYDGCGKISVMSNVITFTTAAVDTNEGILSWNPVDGATSYTVGYGLLSRFTPGVNGYQYTISNAVSPQKIKITTGATYFFSVKTGTSGWGNEIEFYKP